MKLQLLQNKYVVLIGVLVAIYILVIIFEIPVPFRYSTKGGSFGKISVVYKTDRFTGKTTLVHPFGERDLSTYRRAVSPAPQPFPTQSLVLGNMNGELNKLGLWVLSGEVKNNSNLSAKNIILKVTFRASEKSDVIDTQYPKLYENILAGDTKSFDIGVDIPTAFKDGRRFWFGYEVYSAEISE